MTSSTKPEVPNLSQCHYSGTGPLLQPKYIQEIWLISEVCYLRYRIRADRQTDIRRHWSQYLAPLWGSK